MSEEMSVVKLQSSDGIVFIVDLQVADQIGHINKLTEITTTIYKIIEAGHAIPLPSVNGKILKIIIKWIRIYIEETSRIADKILENVDQRTLFDIIEAASICCIENLLESATEMAAKLNFK